MEDNKFNLDGEPMEDLNMNYKATYVNDLDLDSLVEKEPEKNEIEEKDKEEDKVNPLIEKYGDMHPEMDKEAIIENNKDSKDTKGSEMTVEEGDRIFGLDREPDKEEVVETNMDALDDEPLDTTTYDEPIDGDYTEAYDEPIDDDYTTTYDDELEVEREHQLKKEIYQLKKEVFVKKIEIASEKLKQQARKHRYGIVAALSLMVGMQLGTMMKSDVVQQEPGVYTEVEDQDIIETKDQDVIESEEQVVVETENKEETTHIEEILSEQEKKLKEEPIEEDKVNEDSTFDHLPSEDLLEPSVDLPAPTPSLNDSYSEVIDDHSPEQVGEEGRSR